MGAVRRKRMGPAASHQDQEGGSVGKGPSSVAGVANGGSNNVTDNISKFYIKNNGVVYESDIIQVFSILLNYATD